MTSDDVTEQRLTLAWMRGEASGVADFASELREASGKAYALGDDARARQLRTTAELAECRAAALRKKSREYAEENGLDVLPCDG